MKPTISIIIVNYNGLKYLGSCINSLFTHLSNLTYEIIVVDNDSKDDSVSFIKKNFADVIVIESNKNLGFGKANNLGVSYAKGETILLLNNDTILLNDIKPALEVLYSEKNYGIVSINMLNSDNKYIPAVGRFPSPFTLLKISFLNDKRKEFEEGEFNLKENYIVDWVTGAFMLITKKDYLDLHGFDSGFFMYVEDVDFCKRMNNAGKKCVFVPSLNYIHFVGHTTSRNRLLINGYKMYSKKHFSGLSRFIALLMISVNMFIKRITNNI
ncbi:glycosyltransferase family 2 protein [Flavobacterium sp. KBS0721]|uniref:glycosyltransferase family 2 protein n=1 Tax=Flavobacterium sp. KBS0721 TaxID=1179672 RepID=UPI00098EC3B2|nr:glycosyltransferase family 2 protein [Flavobacterium sp. KBS0721]QDW19516.1 glycosyltransferase family 2 protein [Flavobacterium sp. KBS0721]